MLVPALRDIQERHGYLPAKELELTALRLSLPLYQVQEVASYFPHFRLQPPATICVGVCQSMSCHLRGAGAALENVRRACQREIAAGRVELKGVSCLGRCDQAPVIALERHGPKPIHDHFQGGFQEVRFEGELLELIQRSLAPSDKHPAGGAMLSRPSGDPAEMPETDGPRNHATQSKPLWQIDVYDPGHGDAPPEPYAALRQCLRAGSAKFVLDAIKTSGLVGMGGAAARTAKKWTDVLDRREQPKYVVCNGDESEPGTFKDREILLHAPHLVVEGLLIAGVTVGAQRGYIYIRHEYPEQIAAVHRALQDARMHVPEALRRCDVEVFVSPGAYICGEESALLEAIEGRRAQPRNSPPDIRTNGLFDKPTVVNNVETLAWAPAVILRDQGKWYRDTSLRFFSVSGDVQRPGVFEVPTSTTLGELLGDAYAGGMRPPRELHAVATSGPSGGFLPRFLDADSLRQSFQAKLPSLTKRSKYEAERLSKLVERLLPADNQRFDVLKLPLDVSLFRALDLALGAGIVVYGVAKGQRPKMLRHALNCLEFFEKESCGKCVPCRLGCQQLVHLAGQLDVAGDKETVGVAVRNLALVMEATSICGLGRAAANPLTSYLDHFADELAPSTPGGPLMNGESFTDILDIYESQYARDLDGRLIRIEKATQQNLEEKLKVKIDGQEVEIEKAVPATDDQGNLLRGPDGRLVPRLTTILDAATKLYAGRVPIPVLCHQEHLKPIGVCRVCSVLTVKEGEVAAKLAPACQHPLVKGMEVHTRASPAPLTFPGETAPRPAGKHVAQTVRLLIEMLAAHTLYRDEPTDNRRYHNELLALCQSFGVPVTSTGQMFQLSVAPLERRPHVANDVDASSPIITLDRNQCILCDRCVRSCSEVKPFKIIGHTGFGNQARISFDLDQAMGESGCKACGECAIACPTGALTFKGTVYGKRDPWSDHAAPKPVTVKAEELAATPLFAGIPYAFLKWNEGAVGRVTCTKPTVLCRQGDYGATAFVIEAGGVEVLVGASPEPVRVATPKDVILGEMACMTNQPRTATLRAQAGARVLVVRRNMLHMLQRNRAARAILFPLYRQRAIDTYLRRGQLFTGLTPEQNQRCIDFLRGRSADVEFLQVDPGQTILRQDDPADSFAIVYLGHVKVSERTLGGPETVIDYLGPGRHFGEIGLMTGLFADIAALVPSSQVGRRTASCTALDHVELVRIKNDVFSDLLEHQPEIAERLKQRCRVVLEKNRGVRSRFDHDLDEFTRDGLYQGQNLLVIDLAKCTRCQECVNACSNSHGGVTRLLLEGNRFDRYLIPSACRSCHDPACLVGCPVDAIHRRPPDTKEGRAASSAIVIEDHCIGCGLCAFNCPFGSIHMTHQKHSTARLATNCDLCESIDGKPRCVYACPHDAAKRLDGHQFALQLGLTPMGIAQEQRR